MEYEELIDPRDRLQSVFGFSSAPLPGPKPFVWGPLGYLKPLSFYDSADHKRQVGALLSTYVQHRLAGTVETFELGFLLAQEVSIMARRYWRHLSSSQREEIFAIFLATHLYVARTLGRWYRPEFAFMVYLKQGFTWASPYLDLLDQAGNAVAELRELASLGRKSIARVLWGGGTSLGTASVAWQQSHDTHDGAACRYSHFFFDHPLTDEDKSPEAIADSLSALLRT